MYDNREQRTDHRVRERMEKYGITAVASHWRLPLGHIAWQVDAVGCSRKTAGLFSYARITADERTPFNGRIRTSESEPLNHRTRVSELSTVTGSKCVLILLWFV